MTVRSSVLNLEVSSSNQGSATRRPEGVASQRQSVGSKANQKRPLGPALRANPYPEVTDLFCRLPLPTLFYWPEAFHLGDLLRIWVRICTKFTHLSPNSFKGQCKRIGWHKTCATFSGRSPYLRANRFQGTHFTINEPLNKKRQLSPKLALT